LVRAYKRESGRQEYSKGRRRKRTHIERGRLKRGDIEEGDRNRKRLGEDRRGRGLWENGDNKNGEDW
jgi:hypothetical protein